MRCVAVFPAHSGGIHRPALRLVHREAVVLLGGGRALLMQLAHPAVAAGVAEHSGYRVDRLGRLLGTLRPMFAITFGNEEQVAAAAAAVRTAHERVRGSGYEASDPALLAWVLATLIDSALLVYDQFIGPLPLPVADEYYTEMLDLGELLDMPRAALPPTREQFQLYMANMVASMSVTSTALEIERELFAPLPGSGPMMLLMHALTAGLLPPKLRDEYGLSWDPAQQAVLAVAMRASRACLPFIPSALRRTPTFLMPSHNEMRASFMVNPRLEARAR